MIPDDNSLAAGTQKMQVVDAEVFKWLHQNAWTSNIQSIKGIRFRALNIDLVVINEEEEEDLV